MVDALEFDLTQADSTDGEMPAPIVARTTVQRPPRQLSSVWREGAADLVCNHDARAAEGVGRNLGSVLSLKGRFLHQSGVSDGHR